MPILALYTFSDPVNYERFLMVSGNRKLQVDRFCGVNNNFSSG
jgi:hypothetical protein